MVRAVLVRETLEPQAWFCRVMVFFGEETLRESLEEPPASPPLPSHTLQEPMTGGPKKVVYAQKVLFLALGAKKLV